MKRWLQTVVLGICALLATGCAQAEAVKPDDDFFDKGRNAMTLLSEGKVEQAFQELAFSFTVGSEKSEDDFKIFVSDSFALLDSGEVQNAVAVCWLDDGGQWHLGIPVVEPITDDIEALVLDSWNLESFSGYSASTWGALKKAVARSQAFYWNEEYLPGTLILMADE